MSKTPDYLSERLLSSLNEFTGQRKGFAEKLNDLRRRAQSPEVAALLDEVERAAAGAFTSAERSFGGALVANRALRAAEAAGAATPGAAMDIARKAEQRFHYSDGKIVESAPIPEHLSVDGMVRDLKQDPANDYLFKAKAQGPKRPGSTGPGGVVYLTRAQTMRPTVEQAKEMSRGNFEIVEE
jgi:hypothetical protein